MITIAQNYQANRLLSALPEKEYPSLRDFLEPVELSIGQVLLKCDREPEFLYFPLQAVVSSILEMNNSATTEVGLIGNEGMVGTLEFIGQGVSHSRSIVQVKGSALRIKVKALRKEFDRAKTIQKLLLQDSLRLFNQVSQIAACNNHHTVKQRTALWLLMLDDRRDKCERTLSMTHQLLSQMLGVRRTGITQAAKEIQQQGIISYKRGEIEILDRQALEEVACECYQMLKI